jgi:predicted metal-dependent TIM-barrel fold hydrolase
VAVCEPAFWAGFDRSSAAGFYDYFCQLTQHEPQRAAKFGLPHFCWLCINPKESEDVELAREVIALIPKFLDRPNVLGIGEIGLNKNSRNELKVLELHVELAATHDQLILVHTPHLEDKLKGTRLILDVLRSDSRIRPERCIIDHVEEHTVKMVLDAGFWAGMTLYPESKCTAARAVDIIESYSAERLWMNSACDWGVSVPLAVPYAALEMRRRGHGSEAVERLIYQNPVRFLSQTPRFKLPAA